MVKLEENKKMTTLDKEIADGTLEYGQRHFWIGGAIPHLVDLELFRDLPLLRAYPLHQYISARIG